MGLDETGQYFGCCHDADNIDNNLLSGNNAGWIIKTAFKQRSARYQNRQKRRKLLETGRPQRPQNTPLQAVLIDISIHF